MGTLADLLSSRVKAEMFRLLFGTSNTPLHLREIERRSGLSVGTVRQELTRLEDFGLIEKNADGNRRLYAARRDHPLSGDIHNLVLKTSGLVEVLREALTEAQAKICLGFVFGSMASGKDNATSDVDLFIVGELGLRTLSRLLARVPDKLGREINPYVLSAEEFLRRKREGEHFVSSELAAPHLFTPGGRRTRPARRKSTTCSPSWNAIFVTPRAGEPPTIGGLASPTTPP